MKTAVIVMMMLFVMFAAALSLGQNVMASPQDDGVVRIGGSTTMLPVVANIAENFKNKYKTWNNASPGLPNKNIVIYATGGGSGFGVKSTAQGTSNIGLVARELGDKEKKLLGAYKLVIVGKDAVAFAVNKDNPMIGKIKNLKKDQLADIFSGKIKTYKEIDPSFPNQKIVLLVRDPGAGSAEVVQDVVMGKEQISKDALQLPSQGALLKKLETNRYAIAYISVGLLSSSSMIKGFSFQGVEPTVSKIVSGEYALVRPLYMVVKEPQDPLVKRFIEYSLENGQKVMEDNHFVPVTAPAKKSGKGK